MAADGVTDALFGMGGIVVGGLTTWALVAGRMGSLVATVKALDARIDRHEALDDERFKSIDAKLDRLLDALAGNLGVLRHLPRP
jgi:hypothetical protein